MYPKCPICTVARPPKKIAKAAGKAGVGAELFEAQGCEAIGLRHFGDGRMDRFSDGVGALVLTSWATMDLMEEQRRRRFPPPPPPPS